MIACRLLLSVASFVSAPVPVLDVQILAPGDGAVVAGDVEITGTARDLGAGRVSVSIDGGPFVLASGTDSWSFSWDSTAAPDGLHTVTARARESIGGPAVFDMIQVDVDNGGGGLSVAITSPADGTIVLDTLTVSGTSLGASVVELAVDSGPFQPTNGLDPWNAVFEPGSLAPGAHVLTARAGDGVGQAFDSVSITVDDPPPGSQQISYASSVDGEPLGAELWIPAGFDPDGLPVPLVVHLHGGGGSGTIQAALGAELDARGWIGLSPDGRLWDLHDPQDPESCGWVNSAAYVDNPDPEVGPGEQDILDAVDWAVANYPIDADRIYLIGFSMGGRGTYIIGLKNPDRFAGIGPMGPASDMYEIFVRRPNPSACKEGMVGGAPGDSPFVDTMYTITSGRFLLENACNLPVYHGHGLNDTTANNDPGHAPFLHGWHMVNDASWSDCHAAPDFCFGHTPTLAELEALHPDGYDHAFLFTPVGHMTDPKWFTGTPVASGTFGEEDPLDRGQLLGMLDFFERRPLVRSPETVVYKSYTSTHRRAYWTSIDVAAPWTNVPGAIRATRDTRTNRLDVELVRVATATIDLALAGLELSPSGPLTLAADVLVEPTFDPALSAPGEPLVTTFQLDGAFATLSAVRVTRDGVALDPSLVDLSPDRVSVGPLSIDGPTTLELEASATGRRQAGAHRPRTGSPVPPPSGG